MKDLFYTKPYIKNFYTNITSVKKDNNNFLVTLEKTYFYYGGGGQISDTGKINNINIVKIFKENNIIIHVLESNPEILENVFCEINWEVRFDSMTKHLSQHIISGAFFKLFNKNTISAHLGSSLDSKISTVDISGKISEEEINQVEIFANNIISNHSKVEMLSGDNNINLDLRKNFDTKENLRIVKIENVDATACCGLHPKNSIELKCIKIIKSEKSKNNTRLEFLTYNNAIEYLFNNFNVVNKISNHFNSGLETLYSSVLNLEKNLENKNEEFKNLESEYFKYKLDDLKNTSVKLNDYNLILNKGTNENTIRKIGNILSEEDNNIILQGYEINNKKFLIFNCSKNITNLNIGQVLKSLLKNLNGKGGGNKIVAQGFYDSNVNLNEIFEMSKNIISENII